MALVVALLAATVDAGDQNGVFAPCADAKIQRWDGFAFGIAFSSYESFFSNGVKLSPCDSRLSLSSNGAQLAVFRPKVDEISLLTINTSNNPSVSSALLTFSFHLSDLMGSASDSICSLVFWSNSGVWLNSLLALPQFAGCSKVLLVYKSTTAVIMKICGSDSRVLEDCKDKLTQYLKAILLYPHGRLKPYCLKSFSQEDHLRRINLCWYCFSILRVLFESDFINCEGNFELSMRLFVIHSYIIMRKIVE